MSTSFSSANRAARVPLTPVPLTRTPLPALDGSRPPWAGTVEKSSGAAIHVRRTPGADDATAVYVHGLGGSSTNWTDLAGLLAPFAAGVALDLPGFGFSEPAPGFDFSLDSHANVLADYIAGLDSGPVHLIGNSMGGAIALLLAARRPELVRTLTLISPAMPDRRINPRRLSDPRIVVAYLPLVGGRMRRRLAELDPRERAIRVIRLCFAEPATFAESRLTELAAEHGVRAGFDWAGPALDRSTFGIFRTWSARGAASLWAIAPTVTAPTLVVWGSHDRVISVRRAAKTARLVPRARLLVLPRTGHVAQMERPIAVARAVLGMWESVEARNW